MVHFKEIISRDAWGGGIYQEEYAKHSPARYCILPQIRLEPILSRRAKELNPTGIHYVSEVVDVLQDDDHVTLKISQATTLNEVSVRFAIAADGGRSFTTRLGIEWLGERDIFHMVSAHFKSPLRELHPDSRNFITWFSNPELGGSTNTGYLYQIGPWPREPGNEEWVFACGVTGQDPERFDNESMLQRLRKTLDIEALPIELLSFSHWNVNAIYAERYRARRVFLVGDACHKIPPWGALGMNTGVQDAQNLIWKLEMALKDKVRYDKLLNTYEIERQPVGKRVGLSSLHNMRTHSAVMDVALGLSPNKSVEENRLSIEAAFDPSHPNFIAKRAAIDQAQKILDCEFKAPGFEVGWFYPSVDRKSEGGQAHGGQTLADGSLRHESYIPSTIPGHSLPHAWLSKAGERVAVFDLVPLNRLLLIARQPGWESLEDERVKYEIIGSDGWEDIDGDWSIQCGTAVDGAVLVRPDRIVAWRGNRSQLDKSTWRALIDELLHCSSVDNM